MIQFIRNHAEWNEHLITSQKKRITNELHQRPFKILTYFVETFSILLIINISISLNK